MQKIILLLALSIAAVAQTAAPTLNRDEALMWQLLNARQTIIQQQQELLQRDYAAFVSAVELAHPGYRFVNGQLEKIPDAKK